MVLTTSSQLGALHNTFQKILGIGQVRGRFSVDRRSPSMLRGAFFVQNPLPRVAMFCGMGRYAYYL